MSLIQTIGVVGIAVIIGGMFLVGFVIIADQVITEHRRGDHGTLIFFVGLFAFLGVVLLLASMAKGELG